MNVKILLGINEIYLITIRRYNVDVMNINRKI